MKFKVFSKIRFFFLIYSVMIFSACHDSDKIEPEYGERTVLIYMAADNNLNKDGETNIKSILKGMEQTAGRLVIYIDPRYDVPRLLTVKGGERVPSGYLGDLYRRKFGFTRSVGKGGKGSAKKISGLFLWVGIVVAWSGVGAAGIFLPGGICDAVA